MPTWLIPIVIRMLAQAITPDTVKGVEAEVLVIIEKALTGHPMVQQIMKLLADALGVKIPAP